MTMAFNRSVLLIDDDEALLSSFKRVLGNRFDLSVAQSGREGIASSILLSCAFCNRSAQK